MITPAALDAVAAQASRAEPGLVEVGAWRSLRPSPPAPLRSLADVAKTIPDGRQP